MQPKIHAIHFDMDGVIANTEPLHVQAELQTCKDYGFAISEAEWGDFKGRTDLDIFTYILQNYGDKELTQLDNVMQHKTDLFIQLARESIEPFEGVLDFIAWTKQYAKAVNLVTSSNEQTKNFILKEFGLEDIFDHITTANHINNGKPHPEPYLRSVALSGIESKNSVVIEDSMSGIKSGLAAGCHVLAVTTSHPKTELETAKPTFIVEDYYQARDVLKHLVES